MSGSRPNGKNGKFNIDGLRLYLEAQVAALAATQAERDKRYEEKFAAVEKLMTQSFAANEKAVVKAEEAQQRYNERSNEFRAQLEDQTKRLMLREEVVTKFLAYDEKFESFRAHFEGRADENKKEIIKLREQQMAWAGEKLARYEGKQTAQWTIGQIIALVIGLSGFAVALIELLRHSGKP